MLLMLFIEADDVYIWKWYKNCIKKKLIDK